MSANMFLMAVLIAVGFIAWPILGRYSQATENWVCVLVVAGTTASILTLSARGIAGDPRPSLRAVGITVIAGVVNGLAVWLYTAKTADPTTSAESVAALMVTVAVLMAVSTPLLNWAVIGAVPSLRQVVGFASAAVAIYFLR